MRTGTLQNQYIDNILRPLVLSGLYKDEEVALRDIVLDFVKRKELHYLLEIEKLEKKYGLDFEKFSKKIKNTATIGQEEDWMTWKAAIEMLSTWRQSSIKILKNG